MTAGGLVVLQEPVRLSRSLIWDLHEATYRDRGPDVFSSEDVPYRSTTSPVLARAFAELVRAFASDCLAGRFGPVSRDEPLYVVDLGGGTGRLGWHLLEQLRPEEVAPLRVVYVLTDAVESNVRFASEHPRLAGLAREGRADFAVYRAGSGEDICLIRSGAVLAPGRVANPIVGIANYLFNVMRQDLFAEVDGEFCEELVSAVSESPALAAGSPEMLRRIGLRAELASDAGAASVNVARILAAAKPAPSPGSRILYPGAAIEAIRRFVDIGGGRSLLLCAERTPQALAPRTGTDRAYSPGALIGMGAHGGTISLPVDLDVLSAAVDDLGGEVLRSAVPASRLELFAILVGDDATPPTSRLRRKIRGTLGGERPDDLIALIALAAKSASVADAAKITELIAIIAILRVAAHDPYVFRLVYGALAESFQSSTGAPRRQAIEALESVAALDYPLNDDYDLVYGVAAILTSAGCWSDALRCLRTAAKELGSRTQTSYNIAICELQLGNATAARAAAAEALTLDPANEPARSLLAQIDGYSVPT